MTKANSIAMNTSAGSNPALDALSQDQAQMPYPGADVYFSLLKPRVMSLVIFTALVGLLLAPGSIHPVMGFTAILCIAIGAGASGALNMWYDSDIDAEMVRTQKRPIPAGKIDRGSVLGFGIFLSVASVTFMALAINWVAAGLLAFTIFFYAVIYSMWLKRSTAQNIVIGGAAGAFPPVIGWAAVTGTMPMEAWVLFAIIFFWTPPHFWALSLFMSDDYKKVGIPMLPVVAGETSTRRHILAYSILLAPLGVLPWAMGFAGDVYGIIAAALGLYFLVGAVQVWRGEGDVAARKLFKFSILYLFLIFATLAVEKLVLEMLA